MFTNYTVAAYFAIGFGGWVFFKLQRMNGNNTKESLVASIGVGIVSYIAILVILNLFGAEPAGTFNAG